MIKYVAMVSLGSFLALGSQVAFAEAPEVVQACTACHSEDGFSKDPEVPTIAGASDYFLENQMAIFAAEARPCEADYFEQESETDAESHCALASSLSEDEQIEAAGYYAGQPFRAFDQEVDEALAAQGAAIHEANCERCHSDAGTLALDDAGILAGQPKAYLIEQFEHFKAGERWQPEKMQPEMDLDDQEMQALAEFYAQSGLK
ncbi:MAG: c-type cytochrome [Wenzhouxiangellaceae bacterium]|nr:c-type cytochrome [Wenzhouxiangellaceae bacterium]